MEERSCHPLMANRKALQLTRVDLAFKIRAAAERRGMHSGTDKARVRKWEINGVTPDAASQIYIAESLGVPEERVDPRDWPNWLPGADGGVIPLGPPSTVALREALKMTTERSRRTFLTSISSTALLSLAGTWAAADTLNEATRCANDGNAVGDEMVALLEHTSTRYNSLPTEQRQYMAPVVDAHLTAVTNLIDGARYSRDVERRLHALAASLSQTVAWHRFDHGLHIEAQKYWIAGLHSAHAGHDRDMGAALLGDLAYQASWRQDPRTAAGILKRALSRTTHPVASSLLQLRLARALAAQGERQATFRALNAAEHLLGAASGQPTPDWCAWYSEADLAVDSGQCLLELGDSGRAHQLILEGQQLLPPSRDKTRGVFLTYQAKNQLELGDPELAATTALEALQLAQRIGAPRCIEMVRELLPRFEAFRAAQGVPELLLRAAQ
ncbi:XRE family transcriptional regulator [Streptomyces noursei]|uniref:XRE family transcriptional regulator n=1 Tax=Streptomyces noursei TaxID=1971 RepID=UPI0035D9C9EE